MLMCRVGLLLVLKICSMNSMLVCVIHVVLMFPLIILHAMLCLAFIYVFVHVYTLCAIVHVHTYTCTHRVATGCHICGSLDHKRRDCPLKSRGTGDSLPPLLAAGGERKGKAKRKRGRKSGTLRAKRHKLVDS